MTKSHGTVRLKAAPTTVGFNRIAGVVSRIGGVVGSGFSRTVQALDTRCS